MMTTTKTSRYVRTLAAIVALAVTSSGLLVAQARPAEATIQGKNGKIVFTSDRTDGAGVNNPTGDQEIFSMNPDGTGLKQLTHNVRDDFDPVLSPSSITIAYTSHKDGDSEIYTMDINGNNNIPLTNNATYDGEPSFSPLLPNGSGFDIAFTSGRDSNDLDFEIYKMNADGTQQVRLTNEDAGTDEAPSWSPDGEKIAFTSDRETADNPYGDDEIYTMDPDGSNQTNVSKTDKWSRDEAPSWSPDGKQIAFQSNRNANNWEIYKMNADGTQQVRLTNNLSLDMTPSWSPDGRYIAFATQRDGDYEVYTMSADGISPTNRSNHHPVGNSLAGQDFLPDWGRKPVLQQL